MEGNHIIYNFYAWFSISNLKGINLEGKQTKRVLLHNLCKIKRDLNIGKDSRNGAEAFDLRDIVETGSEERTG